ncbi:hypothetical protein ACFX13_022238 [Malus domestica]|uniref:Transmembrane protein n=1 Tax=Malus domestica TaxID=3750 RepID=A0A498HQ06_MALDO|nr:uncharacterized protein LOC126608618 [Malus sylvestris]RXH72002.1 hypothetical protein DVH24_025503 [Malus domestica]
MIHQERHAGTAPHGILLALVVVALFVVPSYVGEQGGAIIEAFSELLSQLGFLLLPIILLVIIIQFLSSSGSFVSSFSTGDPYTTHSISGSPSPVGVALFLCLVLFLLYNKVSIFGGGGDDEGEE